MQHVLRAHGAVSDLLLARAPMASSAGHTSPGPLSDFTPGCSPGPEEGNTPGRSTAQSQLLGIVLLGKCPERGHASGSHEPSACPVDSTQGLFLAVVRCGEEEPA